MKYYELTYLISSELSEEEAKQLQAKITSLIGGILVKERLPFKKKLAYPIKKQSQAYFSVIDFQVMAEKLIDLEKKLKSEDKILRYLILVKPPVKKEKITGVFKKPKIEQPEKEKKVELKEIEKKLEEILKE